MHDTKNKNKVIIEKRMKSILKKIILTFFNFFIQYLFLFANKIELLAYNKACETFGCKEK
jgi:hypothetical protein